jgi:hypothetical protein
VSSLDTLPNANDVQDAFEIVPLHHFYPIVGWAKGPIPERSKTLRKTAEAGEAEKFESA